MKIAILQCNFIVGDLEGNAAKIIDGMKTAKENQADFCLTSELALLGYPPRDLLLHQTFIKKAWQKVQELAISLKDYPPLLLGVASPNPAKTGRPLYNNAALLQGGIIQKQFYKSLLPTYDVFDEDRYFESSSFTPGVFELNGQRIGVTICEDIWNDKDFWSYQRYHKDPIDELIKNGANYIVNLSASPFTLGKQKVREAMIGNLAAKYKVPIIYTNQVGGNDDLVFDGRSLVFDAHGRLMARGQAFLPDVLFVDFDLEQNRISEDNFEAEAEAWRALVLGTRDYILKCNFKKAILGISGGIDSALVAAITAEAIGKENVLGVLMPSPFSSQGSIDDALSLAQNLGIQTLTLPITQIMQAFDETLQNAFKNYSKDITEENIQARIRGNLLMALSNKYQALLLSTGNKSELAVGYCTIYGDMSGGLDVIADVPKTLVYQLGYWVNKTKGNLIPEAIFQKAPSAELRPNQTDQDNLPPYEILDEILRRHIEFYQSKEEIVQDGFAPETVEKTLRLVAKAEFKRKQAAPGIKITDRAFGTGWRIPIACRKDFLL